MIVRLTIDVDVNETNPRRAKALARGIVTRQGFKVVDATAGGDVTTSGDERFRHSRPEKPTGQAQGRLRL